MYLIQSGEVEIVTKFGNGKEFIIEKLFRGSIINHNSFLMDDGIDTDAVCRKPVTLYYIEIETVNRLRKKHPDLDEKLLKHEMKLVNPDTEEPVIDYIIKD
jgi:CRP-like cAMP-binding protein